MFATYCAFHTFVNFCWSQNPCWKKKILNCKKVVDFELFRSLVGHDLAGCTSSDRWTRWETTISGCHVVFIAKMIYSEFLSSADFLSHKNKCLNADRSGDVFASIESIRQMLQEISKFSKKFCINERNIWENSVLFSEYSELFSRISKTNVPYSMEYFL